MKGLFLKTFWGIDGKNNHRPTPRAPDGWEAPRFRVVCVAPSWFQQSGVPSTRPPPGNAFRWGASDIHDEEFQFQSRMMTIVVENANQYGTLSQTRLHALEKKLGTTLPSDYRAFLSKNNGGNPVPSGFWIVENLDGSDIYQLYGLHDGPARLQLDSYTNAELGVPRELLAIGDDGVGNFICVGISPAHHGQVFFIDHDEHPFLRPETFEGITKIADSFSQFIAGLRALPP